MKINRVAIVGGGTAGWLAANHLGVELGRDPDIEITLIESKDIPVIGVGEGTVPRIKETLQKFGISEVDLLSTCDATFKQGIKFANWMNAEKYGSDHFYYHPFSSPYPSGFDVTNYWLNHRESLPFSRLSELYSVAELNRSPKQVSSAPFVGAVDYAYHFNAAKFSELLARNALEKFSIRHRFETIEQVMCHEDGSIKELVYKSGGREEFDFYIDCTGFASLLIGKTLGVTFLDKSDCILSDTALALQEPTVETDEIAPYTLATAHKAGWIWDIPLTNRRGIGFVYASKYMDDNDAMQTFSKYVGRDLQNANLRKVPMKIGYRKLFWDKNCVALGLANGFVEPLEATSILVTDFSAQLLARNFPKIKEDIAVVASYCNKSVAFTWERVIDFVQLHYFISDRRDSAFWQDSTENMHISDVLRERLEMWKIIAPKKSDFFSAFDMFGVENYLFVLYGMFFPTRSPVMGVKEAARSEQLIIKQQEKSAQMAGNLLSHRLWLTELQRALAVR
ncbi:tryptophan halogenase family protein [Cellvibrio sp. UBA7661]|uniref:tryptophan halogenase family protein n=1 Tax=Cellvibrio sp. UBA7661 TaxID=1946311 RepID=UPI002F35E9D8